MENKSHGTEEMYAVVNKHKNVNSKNQDEIVMYENDDLYEASAAEGKGNQDPKHLNTTNSGAEEETLCTRTMTFTVHSSIWEQNDPRNIV